MSPFRIGHPVSRVLTNLNRYRRRDCTATEDPAKSAQFAATPASIASKPRTRSPANSVAAPDGRRRQGSELTTRKKSFDPLEIVWTKGSDPFVNGLLTAVEAHWSGAAVQEPLP